MAISMFLPLERYQPGEILNQYSEWIYFTLVLIFFISIAGITMRRHFEEPYVKPLIITVGLMLTVGVFKFRDGLQSIFEGWGILGTIILAAVAATIPYGLCRGFGMSAARAFYLSYILIYILSWAKFPQFYYGLAESNLGLVNLALLILFFIAVYKAIRPKKSVTDYFGAPTGALEASLLKPEIDREIVIENKEKNAIEAQAEKTTEIEFRTVEDIAKSLEEMQKILEAHRNNLPREERERIAKILGRISGEEDLFKRDVLNLHKLFQRLDAVDAAHFKELRERLGKASGKEKKLIQEELEGEEEKIKIEKTIFELDRRLIQAFNAFNKYVGGSLVHLRESPYPYDALPQLSQAGKVLQSIMAMIKEAEALEEKLVALGKLEKKLLKKELETA
ncbi:MAG: hypothetical protein CVU57_23515 [Deltaproteobacteria bacterium HGW-Deltaproteobacteria-15]|jgi:hypothetical protein|nr:MAG: hypothetical protein CVU57_23515 [Deltaproteobacteria bacterium HGW-Deltaproteobacteria-15]